MHRSQKKSKANSSNEPRLLGQPHASSYGDTNLSLPTCSLEHSDEYAAHPESVRERQSNNMKNTKSIDGSDTVMLGIKIPIPLNVKASILSKNIGESKNDLIVRLLTWALSYPLFSEDELKS